MCVPYRAKTFSCLSEQNLIILLHATFYIAKREFYMTETFN